MMGRELQFKIWGIGICMLLGMLCLGFDASAQNSSLTDSISADHAHSEPAGFNAGNMIMHHIQDAHDWHILDWKGHPVSIPLPIIIYHGQRGLDIFMSSQFHHGQTDYLGYRLDHGTIVAVNDNKVIDEIVTAGIWDFSLTKNAVALIISIGFLLIIFLSIAKSYGKRRNEAPKGLQSLLEPVIIFVRDEVAKSAIGPKYERYLPYLLTIFFFIWINNIMGLIPIFPGGANVTGNVAIPIVMALFTFVITNISGNKHYWKHILWMPGVPLAIKPLMLAIELLGVFIKPTVLVIRLFANITAGHIVILVFISLIFIFGEKSAVGGYSVSVASVAFAVFLNFLEILVGAIQAYVFTLLSAVYFGMAVDESH
jgi:F-type H+-transporting ATPase subunit a